jgi:dihydroneopterin aldolase
MTRYQSSILLTGFEIMASIGIHDFELAAPQRLLIDVEIELEATERPAEDDIGEVLDYDFLRSEIKKLITGRHYKLQETLCHDIAGICLSKDAARRVTVYSRKPDVYPDCQSVGYRLTASR